MELPITKPKKNFSKLRIGLVIFPLFLLTFAPLLYLFLSFPLYYSLKSSSSSSSSIVSNSHYSPSNSPLIYTYNHSTFDQHIINKSSIHKNDPIISPSSSSSSSDHDDDHRPSWREKNNSSSSSSSSPSSSNDHDDDHRHGWRERSNSSSSSSPSSSPSSSDHDDDHRHGWREISNSSSCDIFSGDWVPNNEAPYYTNTTCWAIHEHQNCMKFGRPDLGFMKWRWKPDACELPLFDPYEFLHIMRGKSMAFIGDSVSRNHMQSLICLLSRVEYPEDVSLVQDFNFPRWKYKSYNFTIASFWTTHLVRSKETGPTGQYMTNYYNLYLDEPDPVWSSHIGEFDYIIISSGQWFFRPLLFFLKGEIIGCLYCYMPGVRNVGAFFAYRRAFRTTFKTILESKNFKGEVFLRTFAPSHFENGEWNKGGNCLRTHPYRRNETILEGMNLEAYEIQKEEMKIAKREGKKKGKKIRIRMIDVTKAMLGRGDGHPSRYGHLPQDNVILYNDCVHWCLPGPIDSWNDFLLYMLKT